MHTPSGLFVPERRARFEMSSKLRAAVASAGMLLAAGAISALHVSRFIAGGSHPQIAFRT